jgi:hypothetical protein
MTIFSGLGSGGVKVRGVAADTALHIPQTKYHIGEVLYDTQKAGRGILDKHVVKEVRLA